MTQNIYVSIQARGNEGNVVGGHRTTGVLLEPDLVLLPDLPPALAEESSLYSALLIPLDESARPSGSSELLLISHAEAHGVEGSESLIGTARLAHPSRFDAPRRLRLRNSTQLIDALRGNDGDVWSALSDLGVSDENRRIDEQEVLQKVDTADITVPIAGVVVTVLDSIEDVVLSLRRWLGLPPPRPPK